MAISMLKIRRPLGRLIFNMGIAIPGKTVFLIETAPRAGFRIRTDRVLNGWIYTRIGIHNIQLKLHRFAILEYVYME